MIYKNIIQAYFIARPNRFIAHCKLLDGTIIVAHVKNTGRCKELLTPQAVVYLEHCPSSTRKTDYSLISVVKGSLLINMDSSAPNKIAEQGILDKIINLGISDDFSLKREVTFEKSRFDICITDESNTKHFYEVKGVTLEENGVAMFPDAPTQRGVKHVEHLIKARQQGYGAGIIFIIQMSGMSYFTPNINTHPAFQSVLIQARNADVNILAYECSVSTDTIIATKKVEVRL